MNACQYVRDQIQASSEPCHAVIIAFSFVNTDMRITFKEHFPQSRWILVDTKKEVAHERILARKGHFYKVIEESNNAGDGKSSSESTNDKCIKQTNSDRDNIDNSEWEFQPVDFPHTVLDGDAPTSENASQIMEILKAQVDLMVENKKRRDMSNR